MDLNRNDLCWCGSNIKYKKCHIDFDNKLNTLKDKGFITPERYLIKNIEEIEGVRKSGEINTSILDMIENNIKVGMSTEEINTLVHDFTLSKGAIPAPLNFEGFPKSVCTSINDEICHGIPSENIFLKDGDIINIDVSTIYNGYFSDASRMYIVGNASENAKKLVKVAKECLLKGIEAVKPFGFLDDIGFAVQKHAEENGYSVVREFGGHGIGIEFHEEPFVPHFGNKGEGMILVPGMIFTIEPMVNEGSLEAVIDEENGWTVYTEDGSLSAQWEHTVLVTDNGVEILTY